MADLGPPGDVLGRGARQATGRELAERGVEHELAALIGRHPDSADLSHGSMIVSNHYLVNQPAWTGGRAVADRQILAGGPSSSERPAGSTPTGVACSSPPACPSRAGSGPTPHASPRWGRAGRS